MRKRPLFKGYRGAGPYRKPRKPVNKVSAKRSAEWKVYRPLARQFLKEHPWCERRGCGADAVDVHHWAGRRSNFTKVETFKASCRACNLWAKNHPKEAREEGWIAPVGVYLT